MSDLTIQDWAADLRLNVSRLDGIVDEVEQHIAAGNLDAAALVLGVSAGKIGRFTESYSGLQAKLRADGASPDRALGRDS
jgi:hypothetical protein